MRANGFDVLEWIAGFKGLAALRNPLLWSVIVCRE